MEMPKECKNAVYELYELICSANIRDYIKPKYEYLLYAILGWLEDCADSEEFAESRVRNNSLVETFLQYDNLDDYLDLMECDLRERYLEVRHMSGNRNHTSYNGQGN